MMGDKAERGYCESFRGLCIGKLEASLIPQRPTLTRARHILWIMHTDTRNQLNLSCARGFLNVLACEGHEAESTLRLDLHVHVVPLWTRQRDTNQLRVRDPVCHPISKYHQRPGGFEC